MRAIVFDFDGVIVDSERLHEEALREVCEPLGFEWRADAWVGWPDAEVFVELHRRRGEELPAPRLSELMCVKTEVVLRQVERGLYKPYDGAVELVRESARLCRVGVCSAGTRDQIEPVLSRIGLRESVSALVAFGDTARSKPDPAPYLLAIERLGVPAREAAAVEDSPRGVASARSAGLTVVAVGHTSSRESLGGAHLYVERIAELRADTLRVLVAERAGA